eukprot:TRINITY_DN77732_c0_g1_i1.p1 TRINITY_DN77732_c0_g1~~TRINITY_DN77732_c0_g1_i1.p1  ORF type:complete len:209 (-),score=23.44 TRINITY_DN77732_c0_g1_i1:67-693(-)
MAAEPARSQSVGLIGSTGDDTTEKLPWKVPMWQQTPTNVEYAKHPDGPLECAHKEGYLQKRAGKSYFRWNIRYFEIKDGQLRWWRPRVKDQLFQPNMPRVALAEPRPRPVRCLDMTKVQSVTRTTVKFPYSTRIKVCWAADYSDYQLELRSEVELDIMKWYRLILRFTMESYEVEKETDDVEATTDAATNEDANSDSESGHEDAGVSV